MIKYGYDCEYNPAVSKVTVEYVQDADCASTDGNVQRIVLETVDNGVAPFIRISIPKDEHDPGYWSVSDFNDLIPLFKDFEEKVNYKEPLFLNNIQNENI